MKAIIIEEDRFAELSDLLLATGVNQKKQTGMVQRPEGMSKQSFEILIDNIHRSYHCTFVRWAQSHGASCVK